MANALVTVYLLNSDVAYTYPPDAHWHASWSRWTWSMGTGKPGLWTVEFWSRFEAVHAVVDDFGNLVLLGPLRLETEQDPTLPYLIDQLAYGQRFELEGPTHLVRMAPLGDATFVDCQPKMMEALA